MGRVCAVDYGRTRTGVAFSDASRTLAGETTVITEKNERLLAEQLAALLHEKNVTAVAVGLQGEKCRRFAALLEARAGLPVTLIDERRTTIDAHRILTENGVFRQKRKETVDAVAAALILEIFLKRLAAEEHA